MSTTVGTVDKKRPLLFLVLGIPGVFFLLFFFLPLFSVILKGLVRERGDFSLRPLLSLFADQYYVRIILFTLFQAFVSMVCSLLIGLPGAYILSHYRFFGKNFVKALTTIPFVLPSILVVLGFVLFFGNNGILNRVAMYILHAESPPFTILSSFKAIILAHTFYNFPICMRLVAASWEKIPSSLQEAAQTLGASRMKVFSSITLPALTPGLLASAVMIFMFCFMSFGVILVLGGGPRFTTLEVEVYRLARIKIDLAAASRLAVVQLLISPAILYVFLKVQRGGITSNKPQARQYRPLRNTLGSAHGILILLYLFFVVVVLISPIVSVIAQSFLKKSGWMGIGTPSLYWYTYIFSPHMTNAIAVPLRAILNSFMFACSSSALSLMISVLIAYVFSKRKAAHMFETLFMLPMGVSSIVLALGFVQISRILPDNLMVSWFAVVGVHTIVSYPFVLRSVQTGFAQLTQTMEEAAASLGAKPFRRFLTVELPVLASGISAGAVFAFAISMGEMNGTLIVAGQDFITIPILMYRFIGSYNFHAACALGTLLMILCFCAFFALDRLGGIKETS